MALSICGRPTGSCCCAEGLVPGVLVRVLLAVVQLLLECLGLFLVGERQASEAFFKLEGVEEDAVLVVGKGIVYLLVPDDAAIGRLHPISNASTRGMHILTDMSTSLIQKVLPTRSFARTAAPCSPVYVQLCLSG